MFHSAMIALALLLPIGAHARFIKASGSGSATAKHLQAGISHASKVNGSVDVNHSHVANHSGNSSGPYQTWPPLPRSQPVSAPEHGYFGRKVEHANMESATGDWTYEYGPQPKKHVLVSKDGSGCDGKAEQKAAEKIATKTETEKKTEASHKEGNIIKHERKRSDKDRLARGSHEVQTGGAKMDEKHHTIASSKEHEVAKQAKQQTAEKAYTIDRKEKAQASAKVKSDASVDSKEHEVASEKASGVAKKTETEVDEKTARVNKKDIAKGSAVVEHKSSTAEESHRVPSVKQSGVAEKTDTVDEKSVDISKEPAEPSPCPPNADANCEKERAKEVAARKAWEAAKAVSDAHKNKYYPYQKPSPSASTESSAESQETPPSKPSKPASSSPKDEKEEAESPPSAESKKSASKQAQKAPEETPEGEANNADKIDQVKPESHVEEGRPQTDSPPSPPQTGSMDTDYKSKSQDEAKPATEDEAKPAPEEPEKKEPGSSGAQAQSGTVKLGSAVPTLVVALAASLLFA